MTTQQRLVKTPLFSLPSPTNGPARRDYRRAQHLARSLELTDCQAMDRAHDAQFGDLAVIVPCCEMRFSLDDLCYEWPAGFARFLLEARSPENDLTEEQ